MKKRITLKPWFRNTLLLILGAIIGITIYQFFTIKTIHHTQVGDASCRGGIIKICTGSNEVANYLGE